MMTEQSIEQLMADAEAGSRFRINDDHTADWAMRKIVELEADTAFWKGHYADQAAKIERKNNAGIELMKLFLQDYFDSVPHRQTKTQEFYTLPAGKIGVKAVAPSYERDDAALLPWVKESHAELVQVKESVNWAELKKRLAITDGQAVDAETGEIVPGVTATEGGMKFFVQLAKEAKEVET